MRQFLLFVFAAFLASCLSPAFAQTQSVPQCWPAPYGTGTPFRTGYTADGVYAYWHCDARTAFQPVYVASTWGAFSYDTVTASINKLSGSQQFAADALALWRAHVTGDTTTGALATVAAAALAAAATHAPPAPVFRVAKNGAYTSRPSYPFANGVRSTTAAGRAAVGALCNCGQALSEEGTVTYCGVAPERVAVCKRE